MPIAALHLADLQSAFAMHSGIPTSTHNIIIHFWNWRLSGHFSTKLWLESTAFLNPGRWSYLQCYETMLGYWQKSTVHYWERRLDTQNRSDIYQICQAKTNDGLMSSLSFQVSLLQRDKFYLNQEFNIIRETKCAKTVGKKKKNSNNKTVLNILSFWCSPGGRC